MVSHVESPSLTRDTLWDGELVFWQPARGSGYRFNLDPILLAGFVRASGSVLDLGAGCGIIGTLLIAEGKAERVTSVEIQSELVALARRNAEENGHSNRHEILAGDLRLLELPRSDTVVFNPPYFRVGEGRSAPYPGREIARRERFGTLEDFVRCGLAALRPEGALNCIVRIDRAKEILKLIDLHGGSINRSRPVASRQGDPPRHMMIEACNGRGGQAILEPELVVHEGDAYGDEVRRLLRKLNL